MEGVIVQISAISSNQYNQNFGGVTKLLVQSARKADTILVSSKRNIVGRHIVSKDGAVQGWRKFKGGESINYATVPNLDKAAGNQKNVSYTYRFPDGKGAILRRWFVFDLDKFKENMTQLTSLKGIKKYLADIENAPKVTRFTPCS